MAEPMDTGRPHPARVYDVLLGGKDNFTGLDLVEPGVVPILHWRPEGDQRLTDAQAALSCGVGRVARSG